MPLHAVGLKIPNPTEVPFLHCPLPNDLNDWIKTNLSIDPCSLDKLIKKSFMWPFLHLANSLKRP